MVNLAAQERGRAIQTEAQVSTLTAALRRQDEQIERYRQFCEQSSKYLETRDLCAAQERAVRQLQEYLAGDKEVIAMVEAP